MVKKNVLLLGAHMSMAGGLEKALERGASIGCTALQIFTQNNRRWQSKSLTDNQIKLFKKTQKKCSIQQVVSHASYLINLGSPDPTTNKKSVQAARNELQRCHALDIPYLVLHPGASVTESKQWALDTIAGNLYNLMKETQKTTILLEAMAGQGTSIGSTFQELSYLLYKLSDFKERIGVCFDTCHVFSAGYDIRSQAAYTKTMHEFEKHIGLDKIRVFHLNDSKQDLRSHIDRHEHIGQGKIGLEAFKLLLNDTRFLNVAKILETPKDSIEDDARNLATLLRLLSPKTRMLYSL